MDRLGTGIQVDTSYPTKGSTAQAGCLSTLLLEQNSHGDEVSPRRMEKGREHKHL